MNVDLVAAVGALVVGFLIAFMLKPSTVTTVTTTLTSTYVSTLTETLTTTITSTVTSYYPSTVYRTVTATYTSLYISTVTSFKTVTDTIITSLVTLTTKTMRKTVTTTVTTTVYPKEVPKAELPYLGQPLSEMYKIIAEVEKTYKALSKESNPIVEKFRKAMQAKAQLVAKIFNLKNDLNLIVRYFKELVESDEALQKLTNQELNYNNIYTGYMYLLQMKVDMAMIDNVLAKIGNYIMSLEAQLPSTDYVKVENELGDIGKFLLEVSKPMNFDQALPLLKKAEKVGGPDAVVNAYLSLAITELHSQYNLLLKAWSEAKAYYEKKYETYKEIFSSIPS